MRKVWAVIRREFVERIRTRWFWIGALISGLALLACAAALVRALTPAGVERK